MIKLWKSEGLKPKRKPRKIDPSGTTNLYKSHPEVAARLLKQLEEDVARGRSTNGAADRE